MKSSVASAGALGWVQVLQASVFLALLGALLFVPAGRVDLPFFWAYFGLNAALMAVGVVIVDAGLQRERLHPGPGGRDIWPMLLVGLPCYLGHMVVAGLDVGRFHWSDDVPFAWQVACIAICAASWTWVMWAMAVNRFFSSVIRIQEDRGHRLITAGPYRYVRHPGYTGATLAFLSSPLALGSWWALVLVAPMVLLVIRRTVLEDRFLRANLPGYAEYAERVRYRLLPGIW